MPNLASRLLAYAVFVLLASCSSGGCSSCAGGAIHGIHGEYPLTPETRIPHAIQLRLTQQGLQSVQAIAPDLLGGFLGSGVNIPTSMSSTTGVPTLTICPSGPCHLTVTLPTAPPPLEFGLVPPNPPTPGGINVKARVIITGMIPIHACIGISSSFCIGTDFTITVDTTQGNYAYVGVETLATIGRDTHAERQDYFRADLVAPDGGSTAVIETPGETIENADVNCSSGAACFIVNLLKSTIISQVSSQFAAIVGPIQSQLAATAMPDPPGCPTGTTVNGTYCRYPDNTQVPRLLGLQGTGNFGALLARFTPGLHANASYDMAAGDHAHDSEIMANGMTIDMFGAMTSGGHSSCVPQMTVPPIPTVPEWTTLRQNMIPGTSTTTDLGIGISEEFFNSSLWNLWDSGMFCLGITTRLSQSLSTGLFGAFPALSSLRNVTFPTRVGSMALTLRPQMPPTAHIGTGTASDPLIMLTFPHLAIDFYAFSEERYVRFMTVNTDLSLPVSLITTATGIMPSIGMASAANTTVSNSSLLTATPTAIAGLIGPLLGTALGMFANGLPAVNLPTIPLPGPMGTTLGTIHIQIPSTGIQGLSEGTSRFLGLFANLQYVHGAAMDTIALDTTATLQRLPFDPSVYQFGPTFTVDQLPHVQLALSTPNSFGHDVEYSYQVDDGTWSLWTRETSVNVVSASFMAQGDHHIDVRARMVDEPATEDRDPARVSFTIDTVAPTAIVERRGDALHVTAQDDVSDVARLEYNVTFDDHGVGTWTNDASTPIPTGAARYVALVRDESGNQSRYEGPIVQQTETIRGGPSTDAAGACGCSTPGARGQGTGGMLAALGGLLGAIAFLRRRGSGGGEARFVAVRVVPAWVPPRVLVWGAVALFFTGLGCDCSSNNHLDAGGGETGVHCATGQMACAAMNRCVETSAPCNCPTGEMAQGTAHFDATTCTWDTSAGPSVCNCQFPPALSQGMAGSHLDMAIASDNSVWFSSYSAGDPRPALPYGDLVVGKYDAATSTVAWTNVDGVPSGPVTNDPSGWRGGISAPGDDVGRWNSIKLDAADNPRVAYWDTTNDQLKYAYSDGTHWTIAVVDTTGRNGRYASLVVLPGGFPAIAYRATVTDATTGVVTGQVRYAIATTTTPHQPSDWTVTHLATATTPCRASDCATGQVCQQSNGVCVAPSGTCSTACSATQACVASACVNVYTSAWVEDYPPGIGLFNSLVLDASNHPQLVFYDRDRGNLMGVSGTSSTAFGAPFIIDGEAPDHSDLGDRGMWSTLAVTSDGMWHVAYVDAWNETVLYTTVAGSTPAAMPETVDDGSGLGAAMPFTDGHHIIGDSLALDVDHTGAVRVVYQDSTAGAMRLAVRGATAWTVSSPDVMNSTGYWARIRSGHMATFWRDLSMLTVAHYGVRVFPVH